MTFKKEEIKLYQDKDLDLIELQENLSKADRFLKEGWGRFQNDNADNTTNFIYRSRTYYDVMKNFAKLVPKDLQTSELLNYTLLRWYNFLTSTTVEGIFCKYNIVRAEENIKHKFTDIHILDEPFDVKLSVMPKRFFEKYSVKDFEKREVRDELIRWLYENQSKQKRFHNKNRLFVICWGKDNDNNNYQSKLLKHKFDKIEQKVHNFLTHIKNQHNEGKETFNKIKINHNGKIHTPYSEIILIR